MTTRAVLAPEAERELRRALRDLGKHNMAAARGLNDAVENAARMIGANPAIGPRRPKLASKRYRFWSIPRYRFLLAYTAETRPQRIVRLVHTSRDLIALLADLQDPTDSEATS